MPEHDDFTEEDLAEAAAWYEQQRSSPWWAKMVKAVNDYLAEESVEISDLD